MISRTTATIAVAALVAVAAAQTVTEEVAPGVTATTSNATTVISGDMVSAERTETGGGIAGCITAIEPFTGERQDGFEASQHPNYACPPCFYDGCLPDLVFQGVGTICARSAHITGSWGFRCSIRTHGGTRFYGSTGSATTINFEIPAKRFGAYFGTNAGEGPNARMDFYDTNGDLIDTQTAFFSAFCQWQWNGWESCEPIGKIVITGDNPFGGGFVMLDDMEFDEFPDCDPCDMNCDGAIDAFDIEPFLDLLFGPNPDPCCEGVGDVNGDGTVNAFDIEPFLECLFP